MAKRTPLAPLATGTNNNNIDDDDGDNNNNNNNNNNDDENDNNNNNNNFFFTEYCYENEPKPDAIRQADCYSKVDPCPPGLKDCSDESVCPLSTNKCCCP